LEVLVVSDDKAGGIDRALFRRVMGSFATGVTVITTQARGEVRGMTANAFMSGSLHPPLCIVSVATTARMHAYLEEAGHFGVSILAHDQVKLSSHFSGRPQADLEPVFEHARGTPMLKGGLAALAATVLARHDCGDHSIFIGRIFHLRARDSVPLVVHGGHYASLIYSGEADPAPNVEFW
jgi:flavin reductase (DIM6/NTAB) family NADH-FMN oxidoreductase RutF